MRHASVFFLATSLLILACSSDGPPPPAAAPSGGADSGVDGATPSSDDDAGEDPGDAAVESKVNVTKESFDLDGTEHQYVLAVPKDYDASKKYPLVLIFHGDGGDGPSMRAYHTFDAVSGDAAIVAYPSGAHRGWDQTTPIEGNTDQQFVLALIDALKSKYAIDRVFGSGYSSGGFLVNFLACRNPGLFRGISVYEGGAPYPVSDGAPTYPPPESYYKCRDDQAGVATLVVQGASDGIVMPDSGEFDAVYWAYVNGCGDARKATQPAPCEAFDGCPADKPVHYSLIPGLTHVVWDEGAKTSWAFFKTL